MSTNVYWVLELTIKTGEFEKFQDLMTEMVASTETNEPNTLNYERPLSNDNKTCFIYERYTDSEAVLTHLGAFGEKFAERFMAILDATRFVVYGNPSDQVREAVSGFKPIFMSPAGGFTR